MKGFVRKGWRLAACVAAAVCVRGAHGMTEYFSEDFEDGELTAWRRSGGGSGVKTVSGNWRKLTARFNSGTQTNVMFNIATDKLSQGNLWLDDFSSVPAVPVDNVGFEEGERGWTVRNAAVDSERTHEGRNAVHFRLPLETSPTCLLRRIFDVRPQTEYEFSIHMLVADDFQGDCKFGVYDGATGCRCLVENYGPEVFALTEVMARERNGTKAFSMSPKGGRTEAVRTVELPDEGLNACLSLDVRTDGLKGSFAATLVDPADGRELLSLKADAADATEWRQLRADGVVPGKQVEIRLTAEGEGVVDVDNVLLTAPRTCPDCQCAEWRNAKGNFVVPANVKVAYEGPESELVDSAIRLLEKDLKALGRTLTRVGKTDGADLRLIVDPKRHRVGRNPAQGYELDVGKDRLLVGGAEPRCVFYGVMTILDFLGQHKDRPYLPACRLCDWPGLDIRGFMPKGHTPEQCARLKLNTYVCGTGYPQTEAEWKSCEELFAECRSFGLEPLSHLGAVQNAYYVLGKNPNLACGKFAKDEPVALKGTAPSELARPFVIRTALSDLRVTSADGARNYVEGKDYAVLPGTMDFASFGHPEKAKRFAIARCEGSSIADGETVRVSYDAVVDRRPPYCTFEPEVRRLNDAFFRTYARRLGVNLVHTLLCLLEMDAADARMREDSRVIASGKEPAVLMAEDALRILDAVQQENPQAKLLFYAGKVNGFSRSAAPVLAPRAKDLIAVVWGYDVSWANAYGVEAVKFWSGYGIPAVTMPWDNARNVHGLARLAYDAVPNGCKALGLIGSSWWDRPGDVRDVASSSWRVPRPGEKDYVEIRGLGDALTRFSEGETAGPKVILRK